MNEESRSSPTRIKSNIKQFIAGFDDCSIGQPSNIGVDLSNFHDWGMINDILPAKTIAAGRNSSRVWKKWWLDMAGYGWITHRF